MNLSDIVVPQYLELTMLSIALPVAGLIFLTVVVAIAFWRQRKLTKRAMVAVVSVTVLALVCSFALLPTIESLKDQQDRNFAAALQRTYGATSSEPYSEVIGVGIRRHTSALTRDGKTTNVRFEVKDGIITPIALSEETYPKLSGQ
jgi:hypothetical protein